MTNKHFLVAISVSTFLVSSPFILSSSPILSQTITNSLQNSLFAEAQYGGPIANDDTATTDANTEIFIDVLDNDDLNGGVGPLAIDEITNCFAISSSGIFPGSIVAHADILTQPANGLAIVNGSSPNETIRYSPDTNFSGVDTFTYRVCDADSNEISNTATVTVTVNPPANQIPTLDSQLITIELGSSGSFAPILGNDPDGNTPLTYRIENMPTDLGCVESNPGVDGNIITCTPTNLDVGVPVGFDVIPIDSLGAEGVRASFSVDIVNPPTTNGPTVQVFKDKDGIVQKGEIVTIQLDITNPNDSQLNFITAKAIIDETRLKFVENSYNEGSITGEKFSVFSGIQAEASTPPPSDEFSFTNNTLSIFFSQLSANQTRSITFQVEALETGTTVINSESGIFGALPNSTDDISIPIEEETPVTTTPQPNSTSTVRTGGRMLSLSALGLLAIVGFGILSAIGIHTRHSKITKK